MPLGHELPPHLEAARAKARVHLLTNLLVLPGLGSLLAGRKVGWVQAAVAATGVALTVMWFTSFVTAWVKLEEFPADGGPHLRLGLLGLGLFAIAWVWALATSLQILRESHCRPPL